MNDFGWDFLYHAFGQAQFLSPAGALLDSLNRAKSAVVTSADVTDELRAQLRRCEIRSKWPTWDHKRASA